MWYRAAEVVITAFALSACDGARDAIASTAPPDGGLYRPPDEPMSLPEEEYSVAVEMGAFWALKTVDVPMDGGTYAAYDRREILEGVRVCVDRVRARGEAWDDFRDWDDVYPNRPRPCHTTHGVDESVDRVVLEGVPAMSEILVTATKDGYRPSVIPVAVDTSDIRTNVYLPSRLLAKGSTWPDVDVDVSPDLGVVGLEARACGGHYKALCQPLEGAQLRIEPATGDGPYYQRYGRYDPSGERTNIDGPGDEFDEQVMTTRPRNVMVNVPEGEYRFIVEHDLAGNCRPLGRSDGTPFYGFPTAEQSTVRFPVLSGYLTPMVSQICDCLVDPALGPVFPGNCHVLDGGVGSP